ncbi:MAG: hypothetical protein ACOC7K_00650 [bacterium]
MLLSSLQDYRLGHFTDETRAFFRFLRQRGDVCEIRAPNCPHRPGGDFRSTHSGYFFPKQVVLEEISRLGSRRPTGIYMTLNPVRCDLLARSANKITPKAKHTTADEDIVRRDWLFIDIDSKRPAGMSATDAEVEAALDLAEHIQNDLADDGWPDALLCMSGNGAYLLYRIDLPNDEPEDQHADKTLSKSQFRPWNGTRGPVELPASEHLAALVETCSQLCPPIVHNFLRPIETMNLVVPSKAGKSGLVMALFLCVGRGQGWLGPFPCKTESVLVFDGQLHREMIVFLTDQ